MPLSREMAARILPIEAWSRCSRTWERLDARGLRVLLGQLAELHSQP